MDFNPGDYSILTWIVQNEIKDEKGQPLSYVKKPYLLDILTDWSQEIVIKKCAQIGGSVTFNLKVLFAIKVFGWNVIYTFPTDDDVKEFVSSKTNKLIQSNQHVFKGLPTDNIERKEINGRFLFFKGTISKTAAIMTSSDLNVHDEADRSDQKKLDDYKSRTKASSYKGRWIFSNPTTEKGPVDIAWQKSDQKEWCVTCPSCKLEQYLVWPDNIDLARKIRCCSQCKAELTDDVLLSGKWIAQNPGAKVSGYHISHLMDVGISVQEIIEDSEGDQEYFYNFDLGEPYNPGDLKVSRSTILDNWTPKDLATGHYYLGVDVGNIKHYVLGSERGVIKVGKFTKWSELDDVLKFYNVECGVIDAMPDNTMAKYYVDTYRQMFMSFFGENTNNPQVLVWWGENDKQGIVYSNRHRVLDQLIDYIVNAKMLFALPSDKDFREYLQHWETLRRIKVVNPRGIERYEWESTTGVDHYVFATLYYYLAILSRGSGTFYAAASKPETPLVKSTLSGDFLNLQEVLEERESNV
jgi:phage terminase large subunit GpA